MDAKPILNINIVIDTPKINTYPSIDKNDFFVINTKKKYQVKHLPSRKENVKIY